MYVINGAKKDTKLIMFVVGGEEEGMLPSSSQLETTSSAYIVSESERGRK